MDYYLVIKWNEVLMHAELLMHAITRINIVETLDERSQTQRTTILDDSIY